MKNSNRTPFELRFEIFHTAQSRAEQKYQDKIENYRLFQSLLADGKEVEKVELPSYPSLEEVFEEAKLIKQFIENK